MRRANRFFVLLLLCALSATAQARSVIHQPQDYTLTYGIWGGGFQILTATVHFEIKKESYRITMHATPTSGIGMLLPWVGEFETRGRITPTGQLVPHYHEKRSAWREDKKLVRMTYDRNGKLVNQVEDETDNGKARVTPVVLDPKLHSGAVDLITAIMRMIVHTTDADNCTYRSVTYDGKRRFAFVFTDKGIDHLTPSSYNIAGKVQGGRAIRCQMEMVPLHDFGKPRGYYKLQEQGRALGQLPMVWLAPLWSGGPDVPVRMVMKSDFGTMLMHVQAVKH